MSIIPRILSWIAFCIFMLSISLFVFICVLATGVSGYGEDDTVFQDWTHVHIFIEDYLVSSALEDEGVLRYSGTFNHTIVDCDYPSHTAYVNGMETQWEPSFDADFGCTLIPSNEESEDILHNALLNSKRVVIKADGYYTTYSAMGYTAAHNHRHY